MSPYENDMSSQDGIILTVTLQLPKQAESSRDDRIDDLKGYSSWYGWVSCRLVVKSDRAILPIQDPSLKLKKSPATSFSLSAS
jgi:hypothetical protein